MGSTNNSRKILENITNLLSNFENTPKEINGIRDTAWFRVGEDIFKEFFQLGQSVNWEFSKIKNQDTDNFLSIVDRNAKWLTSFIFLYPNFRLNCEFIGSADNICQVRSGIDVFNRAFKEINLGNNIIIKFNTEGELEEFDRCLKLWIDGGYRPDFVNERSNLFEEHWWWN
ncbi:unnamed protein product [Leptosia nina]|uniref:Uncharacterized protein n=1 Tax=Leptosia nina TaxID=320188 RepID=A0AAV1IX64_9NEOP